MPSLRQHLAEARALLPAPIEAEILLARLLDRDRAYLYAHPEQELSPELAATFADWIARRQRGVPLQYLTGRQEFFGREFHVSPAVLIPRPETELVVTAALERVSSDVPARLLDVATGSGCIAITLALERPQAEVWATDISPAALAVARDNAQRLGAAVTWIETDLLAAARGRGPFDAIISNPPYISEAEMQDLAPEVRDHEPRSAVVAGPNGDEIYRRLIPQAAAALRPDGWLILELGFQSADAVRAMLVESEWGEIETHRDWQHWERVLTSRRHASAT